MGTILTALVLLLIVTAITAKLVKDRRKGRCAGACAVCACTQCACGCGRFSKSNQFEQP